MYLHIYDLHSFRSVTGVQRFDGGNYICRVDFRQSPTVYHNVTLDVIGERNSKAQLAAGKK